MARGHFAQNKNPERTAPPELLKRLTERTRGRGGRRGQRLQKKGNRCLSQRVRKPTRRGHGPPFLFPSLNGIHHIMVDFHRTVEKAYGSRFPAGFPQDASCGRFRPTVHLLAGQRGGGVFRPALEKGGESGSDFRHRVNRRHRNRFPASGEGVPSDG